MFIVKEMEDDERFIVLEEESGWFFPVDTLIQADELCKKFNEIVTKPLDLHIDFSKYDKLISDMNENSRRLFEIDEEYITKSDKIIAKAIEDNFDFKKHYGSNTKEVRQRYANEKLSDLLEEKTERKFLKEEYGRELGFIKRLIDMKIQLIKYEDTIG